MGRDTEPEKGGLVDRVFLQRWLRSLPGQTLLGLLLLVGSAQAATDEVRGVWLTTTGPDHITTGANTESVMSDLRDIGINTVYVETWKNGYTNFPSPTLASLTGSLDRSPFLGSRDLVEETVIHAQRHEMNYIGWFEYGFAAEFVGNGGNTFSPMGRTARDNGWLLRDQAGQLGNASNGFAWMNPAVPEVRDFLIDITLEAVENYDLDGVQFDDRLAWPREFGWDSTTEALYFAETGLPLPTNINDSNFRNWRQSKVTLFAEELTAAVRAVRPDLQLSVSPSVTNFSDVNFNAEWPEWQDDGLFDEYAVQVYRDNFASFNSTLTGQTSQFTPGDLDEFVVGLRGNGTGANTPYADLEDMIERTRQINAAGHAIFYSKAVRDDYGTELTAFYDVAGEGHAANPFFGADNRRAPEVGTKGSGNAWDFNVSQSDSYRVVAKIGGIWREVSSGFFASGAQSINVANATEVELLVDRRPQDLPDFNLNGVVDAADYTIWRDTFASISDLRADANGDNFINGLDYDIWAGFFGQSNASASQAVPEPSAATALLLGWLLVRGRKR